MTKTVKIDRSLYDCDDCVDEALMYAGNWELSLEIPAEKLTKFNKDYTAEFRYNHIDRAQKVVKKSG